MATRALHGVNLSGWLCLEQWITPELFAGTGSLNESEIVATLGTNNYQDLIKEHRQAFITESDFELIAKRGFNAVRLPIPWYVFGNSGPEPGAYVGCIDEVDDAFEWAADNGVLILLALAVNPGSPDADDEVGGSSRTFRDDMLTILDMLSHRYASHPALFGIEVAHEPVTQHRVGLFDITEGMPPSALRNYYRDAYNVIRNAAGTRPVVVLPDAGTPGAWKSFMARSKYKNVWLDTHLYHYDEQVDATGPAGAATLVARSKAKIAQARKSRLPVMVGCWSAALPFADSLMTPEGRIALERIYCSEQIAAFEDLPAWFFQTWKTTGHLSGWDSRIALSSFERRMLS